jgi:hypothetical protein
VINLPSDVAPSSSIEEISNDDISPAGIRAECWIGGVFICPCCGNTKILDFLGDCDGEDISFLVLEECLLQFYDV